MSNDSEAGTAGAANRIRETAKWLTVTLAALGGVLIAGTQFSSIGSLTLGSARLNVAAIGAILAGAGSILVLWATVRVAVQPALTLTSLASGTPIHGTELIIKDQFLLDKHDDLASLAKAYGDAVKNLKSTMDEFLTDPKNIPREPSYAAQSRVTYLAEVVQSLLTAASYEALSYLWRRSLVIIISGGVLAALGTSMFIWAANPPANVQASQANPVVLTSPDLGQVTLSEAGRRAVTEKIGTDCANKPVLNALVLGKTDAGPDVLLQEEGCETARLILVESWGSFNE